MLGSLDMFPSLGGGGGPNLTWGGMLGTFTLGMALAPILVLVE